MTTKITTQVINEKRSIRCKRMIIHDTLDKLRENHEYKKIYEFENEAARLIFDLTAATRRKCIHPLFFAFPTFDQHRHAEKTCECLVCGTIIKGPSKEDFTYGPHLVEPGEYCTYGGTIMPMMIYGDDRDYIDDTDYIDIVQFRLMLFMNIHQYDILPDHLLVNMFVQEFNLNPVTQEEEKFFTTINTQIYDKAFAELEDMKEFRSFKQDFEKNPSKLLSKKCIY